MAKSLDQILSELNPQYQSSQDLINTQLSALPGQTQAGIAQADAKLSSANDNILNSARRRGTGVAFGGIPLSEQANYAATEYAPAIANLQTAQNDKQVSLTGQLAQLGLDKQTRAQSIYDTGVAQDLAERQFQEQQRQFNEAQRASAAASAGAYGFGGTSASKATPGAASISQNGKNFNFSDGTGKAINAAQYSQLTGKGYREVLSQLANAGDNNAKVALQYVGNDGKYGAAPASALSALKALGAVQAAQAPAQSQSLGQQWNALPTSSIANWWNSLPTSSTLRIK